MKKIVFLLLSSLFLTAGEIKVALAANVSFAIGDLIKEFKKAHPDTKVEPIISGSGKLTAQIRNHAPFDIFMSANMKYPQALYHDKLTVDEPKVYAKGSLALFSRTKRDFSKGLELVLDESVKKIAVANPKLAPYGKATFEALKNAKLLDKVKSKFIYGESIAPTVAYAVKVTDLGFIASSSLYSPKLSKFKPNENYIEVDSKLYTPISQGIVLLKRSADNKEAKAFYDFILSKKAKEIFKRYGYIVE